MAAVRTFALHNEVWCYTLFIRIGGTREQAERWIDRKFKKNGKIREGPTATTFYLDSERDHLIWFLERPGTGIIAHEAFHSVLHVCRHLRLGPPCDANEEAYAYLIEWTARQIARRVYK